METYQPSTALNPTGNAATFCNAEYKMETHQLNAAPNAEMAKLQRNATWKHSNLMQHSSQHGNISTIQRWTKHEKYQLKIVPNERWKPVRRCNISPLTICRSVCVCVWARVWMIAFEYTHTPCVLRRLACPMQVDLSALCRDELKRDMINHTFCQSSWSPPSRFTWTYGSLGPVFHISRWTYLVTHRTRSHNVLLLQRCLALPAVCYSVTVNVHH